MRDRAYRDAAFTTSELTHRYGARVHIIQDPFLLTLLAKLCSPQTIQPQFNWLVGDAYRYLTAILLNVEFPHTHIESETRMHSATDRGVYRGVALDPGAKVRRPQNLVALIG